MNIYKWLGRAGRRGLDKFGTVIILPNDELMTQNELKKNDDWKKSLYKF